MTRDKGKGKPPIKQTWTCLECSKKYSKSNDKLMECEFCENYFCVTCLKMTDDDYDHHAKSTVMWFCAVCKPKVEETLKIEKEIEKRCQEHFDKYKARLETVEQKVSNFLDKDEIVILVEEKLNERNQKDNSNEEQIIEQVNKQFQAKTMAEIVKQQMSTVNEEKVVKLVESKVEEKENDISERQNREKNVIIFKLQEPNTNIITERQAKDLENVNAMIDHMNTENEQEVAIEKIIRLGTRHKNYKENPRPIIVAFTNLEGKKSFLRNSQTLRECDNETIKMVSVANDLTKRDRARESELVNLRKEKNAEEVGPWKYVIRGPPGDRKIVKLPKQQ